MTFHQLFLGLHENILCILGIPVAVFIVSKLNKPARCPNDGSELKYEHNGRELSRPYCPKCNWRPGNDE